MRPVPGSSTHGPAAAARGPRSGARRARRRRGAAARRQHALRRRRDLAWWYSRPKVPRSAGSTTAGGEGGRLVHATRVGACNRRAAASVQPCATCGRPARSSTRGLSDPILVRRAKDGDTRALEALCARHAARAERIALHMLARSRGCARRGTGVARQARAAASLVSRAVAVHDLVPPARREHVQGRGAGPMAGGAPNGAARRGRARGRGRRDPVQVARGRRDAPGARAAASPSCRRRRRPWSR